ncbi:hypothetical protein [Intestinimonas butyriciproducens]|uniref:hypothetical protein n=1 Tax=Intestinimonas butyriciproducens TaxID=1297617 RepID=UPI001898D32A|nr:hypothetical protein [Intestinimonas butyriciproducens]MDB7829174.1 hypothetical protein [Intestinimonas butyriciproducens]
MDIEQLREAIQAVEARIWELEARNAELYNLVWDNPKFQEQEERIKQFVDNEFLVYAERVFAGLNQAFRDHFENDDFEISEDEFNRIIFGAQN